MSETIGTTWIERTVASARRHRSLHLLAALLRIFLGFALLPAGLKKVLGEPFTDPGNSGPFHDFLHAFHATGFFYSFVGATQMVVALLLMTQRHAMLGAFAMWPILTAILAFTWSTAVYPTASVVTLMWLGTVGLILWDIARWRPALSRAQPLGTRTHDEEPNPIPIDGRLWAWCGAAIYGLYLVSCVVHGGVYRPRGMAWGDPAFWVLPLLLILPTVTWMVDRRRFRSRRGVASDS